MLSFPKMLTLSLEHFHYVARINPTVCPLQTLIEGLGSTSVLYAVAMSLGEYIYTLFVTFSPVSWEGGSEGEAQEITRLRKEGRDG